MRINDPKIEETKNFRKNFDFFFRKFFLQKIYSQYIQNMYLQIAKWLKNDNKLFFLEKM